MVGIYNGTQHSISIYSISDTTAIEDGRKLVLNEGAQPIVVIPTGKNLNCEKTNHEAPTFEVEGLPATFIKGAVNFLGYDRLPSEAEDKIVIVSKLYRSTVKELGGDTSLFATVDGVVYLSSNVKKPCGCLGLAIG